MKGKLKKIDNTQMRIQTAVATHNNKINSVETQLQALHGSSRKADSDKGAKISEITTYVQNLVQSLEGRLREQKYALSRTHRMVQEIRVRCEHPETTTASTGGAADHPLRKQNGNNDNNNQTGKEKQNKAGQTRERNVHESGESGTKRKRQDDGANVIILDPSLRRDTDLSGGRGGDRNKRTGDKPANRTSGTPGGHKIGDTGQDSNPGPLRPGPNTLPLRNKIPQTAYYLEQGSKAPPV
ncbi:hypothetical protein Bbelb_054800 [Branchiostoma belcheri]|nr:hypothetical protein Bbelb_054800 [Branchiostoma belcheri]